MHMDIHSKPPESQEKYMQKKIKYENDIHWPLCRSSQGKNWDIHGISRISIRKGLRLTNLKSYSKY
jgi:hypothetical protein